MKKKRSNKLIKSERYKAMISVHKFVFNDFMENTYLLWEEDGTGLIIDPGCGKPAEQQALLDFIGENGIRPGRIVNTHAHIDHVLGVGMLGAHFSIPFTIHRMDLPLLERSTDQASMFGLDLAEPVRADEFVEDGETIAVGSSRLKVLHLPGHSPGGIGLYCEARNFIIVGDVLFHGSIGRTDLPGGDYRVLMSSIRNKLLRLSDDCTVYSGHGPDTTIGTERASNPFLQ